MPIDLEKYRHYVRSIDLPQDRKDKWIQIIYSVMEPFADAAFGIHPVQVALDPAPQKFSESTVRCAIVDGNSRNHETKESGAATTEEQEIP